MTRSGYVNSSSIIENRYYPGMDKTDVALDVLVKTGKEFEGKKKLIIFGSGDWYVRMIIENKELLSKYYIIPYIDVDLLDRIVLKDKFYEICEELDIDYPKTYYYDFDRDNDLDLDFEYPVIAKPANSAMYHYADFPGKKKVFKFDTEEELREMMDRVKASGYDYRFLIQDMIPGDDTYMRILTVYCDRDSKVRFASFGRTLLEDPSPTAIGNPVAIINEVNEDIVKAATRFLEHIGYVGFANFDIKYDERDGKYKFFEINVRLGRSNFYVTGSGFNHVKWIVDEYIYGKTGEYTIADNEHLYSVVPKSVIKNYVHDQNIRDRALALWNKGKVTNPLFYSKDKSLKQRYYAYGSYYNYIRKFRRYGK